MAEKKETKTIGVKLISAWIFSVLFIVAGIGAFTESVLSGIFMLLAGIIILPPFNKFLEKKYNLKITTWLKIIIVLVLLVFSGMAIPNTPSDNSNSGNLALIDNSNTQPSQNTQITTPTQTTTPVVEEPTDTTTIGEKNALSRALVYLRTMPFSYSGLIDQLEYEGYSYQEAKYGADNCGADWNEQATLKAQVYLDTMPFSRQGLIDQLIYEGFTQSQAEYGVNAVGY